ncbi:MCP four helix bundle domain-containing protein, partial [Acinetobacter baumannii]
SSEEERAIYARFSGKYERYLAVNEEILRHSRLNENEQAHKLLFDSRPLYDDFSSDLKALVKLNVDGGAAAAVMAASTYGQARLTFIALMILA